MVTYTLKKCISITCLTEVLGYSCWNLFLCYFLESYKLLGLIINKLRFSFSELKCPRKELITFESQQMFIFNCGVFSVK